jgi:hypothetical protein
VKSSSILTGLVMKTIRMNKGHNDIPDVDDLDEIRYDIGKLFTRHDSSEQAYDAFRKLYGDQLYDFFFNEWDQIDEGDTL